MKIIMSDYMPALVAYCSENPWEVAYDVDTQFFVCGVPSEYYPFKSSNPNHSYVYLRFCPFKGGFGSDAFYAAAEEFLKGLKEAWPNA